MAFAASLLLTGQPVIRRLCVLPLAREIPRTPGSELEGLSITEAGPVAVLHTERTVLRLVLYRDAVQQSEWSRAQRRANAVMMGHLPREGVVELPRAWTEVRNGEND
eukprot:6349603-Alexandrium_andersonii.AAC.1